MAGNAPSRVGAPPVNSRHPHRHHRRRHRHRLHRHQAAVVVSWRGLLQESPAYSKPVQEIPEVKGFHANLKASEVLPSRYAGSLDTIARLWLNPAEGQCASESAR